MSFLTSAISSALTPSGTNAERAREGQQSTVATDANSLLAQMFPTLQNETNYADANNAGYQAAMNRLQMLSSPGNTAARAQAFSNAANSQAAQGAKEADDEDESSGLSDAYQAGQNQAISNNATNAIDQYQQQVNSPEYQLAAGNAALGAYANALQIPSLGTLGQLSNLVYSQPSIQVQPGLGSLIGSIAGDYAEGLGGKDTSGGGSGGGGTPAAAAAIADPGFTSTLPTLSLDDGIPYDPFNGIYPAAGGGNSLIPTTDSDGGD